MSDVLFIMVAALIPISLFGFAAFLMYKRVPGWHWFLLCAFLVGVSVHARKSDCPTPTEVVENGK